MLVPSVASSALEKWWTVAVRKTSYLSMQLVAPRDISLRFHNRSMHLGDCSTVLVLESSSDRRLSFPEDWRFIGQPMPEKLLAGELMMLSVLKLSNGSAVQRLTANEREVYDV